MFEELVRRTLKIHFVPDFQWCLISCLVTKTTSNPSPWSVSGFPLVMLTSFRCFLSSCFNALNQNCLSFLSLTYKLLYHDRESCTFFLCVLLPTPFETHISSFHFGCHNEAFFSLLLNTISIEIHLNKNVQIWRMVCCYLLPLSQLLFFFLFQHDAWWYEKISIYKVFYIYK